MSQLYNPVLKKRKGISVVMATYNGEKYLAKQLDSILKQTLVPDEIVICDDKSTDSTVDILKQYSEHLLLRFYVNDKKLGVIENFKKAVSLANPENYIALSDQDDIWLPDKLAASANLLASIENDSSPAFVYSDLVVIDENDQIVYPSLWNEVGFDKYRHNFNTLIFGNFVTGCTVMLNKQMSRHFIQMPSNIMMHDAWIGLIGFTFGKAASLNTSFTYYRKHARNTAFLPSLKATILHKLVRNIRQLFSSNDFLEEQIQLADIFLNQYRQQLSKQQQQHIKKLLSLKRKPFFFKKIVFESVFFSYWTKRF